MRWIIPVALCALTSPTLLMAQGRTHSRVTGDRSVSANDRYEPAARYAVNRIDVSTAREAQPVEPVRRGVPHSPGFVQQPVQYDVRSGVETLVAPGTSLPGFGALVPGGAMGPGDSPELLDAFGSGSPINSTAFPWSAQVRLFFRQGGGGFVCSGTLIYPRTVITAGHCVHTGGPGGTWSTDVSVSAAWDGDDDAYGSANGVGLFSWTAWTQNGDYDWDIGYIRLDRPIGTLTNWLGYGWNGSNSFHTGNTFHHAAYPGCQGSTCFCAFPGCPDQLIYAAGPFDSASTHRLTMNLPNWCMTGGMSGGGIYHIDNNSNRHIYGVNSTRGVSGCAVTSNTFTRITQAKFDDIQQNVIPGAYGASFDLVPLDSNSGPTVMAGGRLPSFDVLFFNNSTANPTAAAYDFEVRLSTNDNLSPSDTLLQTRSYNWNYGARSSARITANTNAPRVPMSTSPGSYWVGAIQATPDANSGNDETDGWDAHRITVVPRPAQVAYDSSIGTALRGLGDNAVARRSLGFAFRFPGASATVSAVDIDSNGRIFAPGSDTSDNTESVGELLSQAGSICALWDDLVPAGYTGTGDVHFRSSASKAVITWRNVRQFGSDQDFSFQLQLFSSGRFAFVYDDRLPASLDGIVGFSVGNGAANPGNSNLSSQPATDANTGTVYEDFGTMDLAGLSVQFNPDGNDGWIVSTGAANFPLPPAAITAGVGRPCVTSIEFSPNGVAYDARNCTSCYDRNLGTSLSLGDDAIARGNALGFPFRFPGGQVVTSIDVDSNGRILPPGRHTSDPSPTVAEFLARSASLCPFHTDLGPSVTGGVEFYAAPGGAYATVTWRNVRQSPQRNAITVQALLRPDHSFAFSYFDIVDFVAGELLIGYTSGNGAPDPGPTDFSAAPFAGGRSAYQFFSPALRLIPDLQNELVALDAPILGHPWRLAQRGLAPTTTGSFLLLGFSNPNLDLSAIPALGLPGCLLLVNPDVPAIPMVIGGSGASSSVSVPIAASLDVIGLQIYVQGANVSPGVTPLGIELSNGVVGVPGF